MHIYDPSALASDLAWTRETLVALLYAALVLCGCGMAVMVGGSIRTDLLDRKAWRELDDTLEADAALFADFGATGLRPDPDAPIYEAVVYDLAARRSWRSIEELEALDGAS